MTKQEFEERTKISVNDEDFYAIHEMYMAAGDSIDKDMFCDDYKKMSGYMGYAIDAILAMKERNDTTNNRLQMAMDKICSMGELIKSIYAMACDNEDKEYMCACENVLSKKERVMIKMENNIHLDENEKEWLKEVLKNA